MNDPYKVAEVIGYTEVVYYAGDGTEIARERRHDDHLIDGGPQEPVTEQEIEDYYS